MPCQRMYIRVHSLTASFCQAKTSLSFYFPSIRGAVDQCTSLYTGQRRVFLAKNSLLFSTTAIRGASALPALLKIACPEVYIRVHFWTRVFAEQKRRRCVKLRTSLSVLKLQGANKNKAETRHRMYILYILWLRV